MKSLLPILAAVGSMLGASRADPLDPPFIEQVSVQVAPSVDPVVPGQPFEIHVEVAPQPGLNVYAPGNRGYVGVALSIDWPSDVRASAPAYPSGELFLFGDPQEPVKVYRRSFRIRQKVTIPRQSRTALMQTLDVAGSFRYQACDDRVCFRARTVPVRVSLRLSSKPRGTPDARF